MRRTSPWLPFGVVSSIPLIALSAPAEPPVAGESPPPAAAASGTDKMLPPCLPVHRSHPKRAKPREVAHAETPAAGGSPAAVPADVMVDARVGEPGSSLGSILGREVTNPKGEDLGRVVDVLADPQGRVRAAIIDFGGFLGVGTRRIAVDWPLLHFDSNERDPPLILSVDRQKLQSAPEYNTNRPQVLLPPAATHAADAGQGSK
jgi:hypothetical protein